MLNLSLRDVSIGGLSAISQTAVGPGRTHQRLLSAAGHSTGLGTRSAKSFAVSRAGSVTGFAVQFEQMPLAA